MGILKTKKKQKILILLVSHLSFLISVCCYSSNAFAQTDSPLDEQNNTNQQEVIDKLKNDKLIKLISTYYPAEYSSYSNLLLGTHTKRQAVEATVNLTEEIRTKILLLATNKQAYEYAQSYLKVINSKDLSEWKKYDSEALTQLIESYATSRANEVITPEQVQYCKKEFAAMPALPETKADKQQEIKNKMQLSISYLFEQILAKGEKEGGLLTKCFFTKVKLK